MWPLLYALLVGLASAQSPVVEISNGFVRGRNINTHYEDQDGDTISVNSFYGIPFAKSPVDELRFADPEPAENWNGTFEAFRLATQCVQSPRGWLWLTHPGWNNYGEDCLNINVFTPEDMEPDEPYAVMVWFYGGAFQSGGNIQYPGHFLAARDVVVVVPNYRVGIFGFVTTDDDVAPGNYGLKDQNLALRWVKENIGAFGGDPNKVTLFGQSAGAASSSLHIFIPESRDLFHQVIAESGTEGNFWTFNYPNSDPADYTRQVAERVECPSDNTEAMIECMRDIEDPWEIRNNSDIVCTPGYFCMGHLPVIEGEGGFIPDYPYILREQGDFAQDVKIMSGYNSEDGSLYTVFMIPESTEGGFNRSRWQHHLRESLLFHWEPQFTPHQAEDVYQAFDWFYTPWPVLEDEELNRQVFNDMITDAGFGYACDKQLQLQSEYSEGNYQYLFGYRSNATLEGQGFWNGTEWVGVPHSGEVPYVFGWSLMHQAPMVRADCRILLDLMDYNQEDIEYTDYVMDLWTNFAKFGNPTPEPVEAPIGNGPVTWPEFTNDERNILIIKRKVETSINYRAKENAFFVEYISYITKKPLVTKTEVPRNPNAHGFETSYLDEQQEAMIEAFLTQQYPGQYDYLYDDEQ